MTEATALTDDELREAIAAQQRRVRVEQARLSALAHEAVMRGIATPGWIAMTCRTRKHTAKRMVANRHALRRMPGATAAYEAGEIDDEHVHLLAGAQRFAPKTFEKKEAELVDDATRLRFDVFAKRIRYFEQEAEPERAEERAQDAFERRSAHCSRTFEDTRRVDATLDPIGGAIFQRELERLEKQLFDADWADARRRLGDAATAADLRRTHAQRRADAMVQMAIRSAAMPRGAKQARVLLSVLVGYETFAGRICELADGTVVTPGQVVPWLSDAEVERAVFGPEGRVIDLGRRSRLFVGGARRAAQLSDLECTDPACDVRFERCEVDHVERWEHGGHTDQDNARLRCPRHHDGRRRAPPPPFSEE